MLNSDKLKGGVIVVLLLGVLAGFDYYGNYPVNGITGAQVSGAGQSEEPTYIGADWECHDGSTGGTRGSSASPLCETYNSLKELAAEECESKCSTTLISEGRTITKCGVDGFDATDSCTAPKTGTGRVRDVLSESKTGTYTIGGKDYEVTLDFVGSTTAKFTINGESSKQQLMAGDQWRLVDGSSWLTVVSTNAENFAGGTRQAEFILRSEAPPKIACADSDSGLDYYTVGGGSGVYGGYVGDSKFGVFYGNNRNKCEAEFVANTGGKSTYYDCCFDSEVSDQLNEGFCDEKGFLQSRGYSCPNGCEEGKCLPGPEPVAMPTYREARWECYDGSGGGLGASDNAICKSFDGLRAEAEKVCAGKCKTGSDGVTKCGVNSFGVYDDCSLQNDLPDLQIHKFKFNAKISGNLVYVGVTFNNSRATASKDVTSPFVVAFRLFRNPLHQTVVDGLKFDSERFYSFNFDVSKLACGANTIEVTVDDGRVVNELTRINNKAVTTVTRDCEAEAKASARGVKLTTGWNIVSLSALSGRLSEEVVKNEFPSFEGQECKPGIISKKVYAYYPQAETYGVYNLGDDRKSIVASAVSIDESETFRQIYPEMTSSSRAVWITNQGPDCYLVTSIKPQQTGFAIPDGFSFVGVPPNWEGVALSGLLKAGCDFKVGAFYDASLPEFWKLATLDYVFEREDVGKGLVIGAKGCSFLEEED